MLSKGMLNKKAIEELYTVGKKMAEEELQGIGKEIEDLLGEIDKDTTKGKNKKANSKDPSQMFVNSFLDSPNYVRTTILDKQKEQSNSVATSLYGNPFEKAMQKIQAIQGAVMTANPERTISNMKKYGDGDKEEKSLIKSLTEISKTQKEIDILKKNEVLDEKKGSKEPQTKEPKISKNEFLKSIEDELYVLRRDGKKIDDIKKYIELSYNLEISIPTISKYMKNINIIKPKPKAKTKSQLQRLKKGQKSTSQEENTEDDAPIEDKLYLKIDQIKYLVEHEKQGYKKVKNILLKKYKIRTTVAVISSFCRKNNIRKGVGKNSIIEKVNEVTEVENNQKDTSSEMEKKELDIALRRILEQSDKKRGVLLSNLSRKLKQILPSFAPQDFGYKTLAGLLRGNALSIETKLEGKLRFRLNTNIQKQTTHKAVAVKTVAVKKVVAINPNHHKKDISTTPQLNTPKEVKTRNLTPPTKEMIEQLLETIRKAIPEETPYNLNNIAREIGKIEKDFTVFKYGKENMIDVMAMYPEDIKIETDSSYSVPLVTVTLLEEKIEETHHTQTTPSETEVTNKYESIIHQNRGIKIVKKGNGKLDESTKNPSVSTPSKIKTPKPKEEKMKTISSTSEQQSRRGGKNNEPIQAEGTREVKSLFRRYNAQDIYTIFSQFNEDDFTEIRLFAEFEDWADGEGDYSQNSILKHFLNRTFARIQTEQKVEYSSCGRYACFNTGLLTKERKDVFILFTKPTNNALWTFVKAIDTYSKEIQNFDRTPEMVDFMEFSNELYLDLSYKMEINIEHIVEDNIDRLPKIFNGKPTLAMNAIIGAVEEMKIRLKRDYSLAVPSYYNGAIQLLLPIDLLGDGEGLVALVADKDIRGKLYRIRTVLDTPSAYGNARVIRRLSHNWLTLTPKG